MDLKVWEIQKKIIENNDYKHKKRNNAFLFHTSTSSSFTPLFPYTSEFTISEITWWNQIYLKLTVVVITCTMPLTIKLWLIIFSNIQTKISKYRLRYSTTSLTTGIDISQQHFIESQSTLEPFLFFLMPCQSC